MTALARAWIVATAVLAMAAVAGCASVPRFGRAPKGGSDMCPESKALDCAGQPQCTYDDARGCLACVCGTPDPFDASPR